MTNSNEPAFSRAAFQHPDSPYFSSPEEGLTKREYFAAMAMQGYISSGKLPAVSIVTVAELSVEQADSLIKALNEIQPNRK